MEKHHHERSTFSGKLGFVLSAAGASVGLGNIWRFPYLAAKYGGGIFLLIYIILALTFGYSMIVAETALGRMTRKSPVGAFGKFGKSKWLSFGGWINAIIPDPDRALLFRYRRMGYQISGRIYKRYTARSWQKTDIFLSLFRMVSPQRSAFLIFAFINSWQSFMQESATE